jgi:hypothetical protein
MAELSEPTENVGAELAWVSQPMRRSWKKTVVAGCSILLAGILTGYVMEAPGFGLIAMLIMFGSLAKFFLPTRYTLNESGVTVKSTTQTFTRKWNVFRSYYVDKNGVLLSPFLVPSRLENFRGLYITFDDNRDEVVAFIKDHIKAPDSLDDSAADNSNSADSAA